MPKRDHQEADQDDRQQATGRPAGRRQRRAASELVLAGLVDRERAVGGAPGSGRPRGWRSRSDVRAAARSARRRAPRVPGVGSNWTQPSPGKKTSTQAWAERAIDLPDAVAAAPRPAGSPSPDREATRFWRRSMTMAEANCWQKPLRTSSPQEAIDELAGIAQAGHVGLVDEALARVAQVVLRRLGDAKCVCWSGGMLSRISLATSLVTWPIEPRRMSP